MTAFCFTERIFFSVIGEYFWYNEKHDFGFQEAGSRYVP